MKIINFICGILIGYLLFMGANELVLDFQALFIFFKKYLFIFFASTTLLLVIQNEITRHFIAPLSAGIYLAIYLKSLLGQDTVIITVGALILLFLIGLMNPNANDDIMS